MAESCESSVLSEDAQREVPREVRVVVGATTDLHHEGVAAAAAVETAGAATAETGAAAAAVAAAEGVVVAAAAVVDWKPIETGYGIQLHDWIDFQWAPRCLLSGSVETL